MDNLYTLLDTMDRRTQEWQDTATQWRREREFREAGRQAETPSQFSGRTLLLTKNVRSRGARFYRQVLRLGPLNISWR